MRRLFGKQLPVAATATPAHVLSATEMETRLLAIEAAMKAAYADVERYAAMVAEGNRRMQELESTNHNQAREMAEQRLMNERLIQQLGNLQGRLENSEHSREVQGRRIGNLEKQAAEVPVLRHQAVVLDMRSRIYQTWGFENMKRLQAADLPYDPEPHIPNVPLPHPDDPGGANYGTT